jgi:hypothetical protein
MVAETFTIVGVSTYGNITKFRVGNGIAAERSKVLTRNGHTKIHLLDLESPMSKLAAINWYKDTYPEYKTLTIPNQAKILKATKPAKPVEEDTAEVSGKAEEIVSEAESTDIAEADAISTDITEDTIGSVDTAA